MGQTFGRSIMKETSKIGKVFDNPIFQEKLLTLSEKIFAHKRFRRSIKNLLVAQTGASKSILSGDALSGITHKDGSEENDSDDEDTEEEATAEEADDEATVWR